MPEAVNDIRSWRLADPSPGEALDRIHPYSRRAFALVVRHAAKPILQTNFLQIAGAVSILKGLDYHRDRFVRIITDLADGNTVDEEQLLHEAVAYVNRTGQYFYFAESTLVKAAGTPPAIPKLTALMMFRNKHTAHRSVDKPWNVDTEQLQTVHAMTLSELGGRLWHPKGGTSFEPVGPFWGRAHLGYQIHTGPNEVSDLVIERDHEALMVEAYGVLQHLLK